MQSRFAALLAALALGVSSRAIEHVAAALGANPYASVPR